MKRTSRSAGPGIELSYEEARRYFVRAQLLSGPKLPAGIGSVERVLGHLTVVQVDSINVAGTNHDIAFLSRIDYYRPEHLETVLYERRTAFEYWLKALSIIRMDSFAASLTYMNEMKARRGEFLAEHADTVDAILNRIRAEGPLSPGDIDDDRKVRGWWTGDDRLVRRLFEFLFDSGTVMIHHRKGRIRYYDLAERCAPHVEPASVTDSRRIHLLSLYHALRLFRPVGSSGDIWRMATSHRNALHKELLAEGTVREIIVEGLSRPLFMLSEDLSLLDEPVDLEGPVRLIPPLDTILWDRKLVADLFGFEPSFEVYKKAEQRKYDYYCLAILDGNRFVGRCDLARDRAANAIRVHSVHWEADFSPDDEFLGRYAAALREHAAFLDCKGVHLSRKRFTGIQKLRRLV